MRTITSVAFCLLLSAASGVDSQAHAVHAGDTFRNCPDCPEMVAIQPGSFLMGAPPTIHQRDEGPVHQVHIRYAFSVSKYPITRREWKQFVKEIGHKDGSDCLEGQQDNHPVVCVSWQDAQNYAAWLSRKSGQHYRLLTEAEYEFVNRAGSQTTYFWGDSENELPQYANMNMKGTTPVGSFKPNAFGLYDTTGNVYSWTQDCYHQNYDRAPTDGSAWDLGGDCSARIIRGGSWHTSPYALTSAYRYRFSRGDQHVGFRLARQ
jgi:formylglycine-generating enzyme required for sulfatase activity